MNFNKKSVKKYCVFLIIFFIIISIAGFGIFKYFSKNVETSQINKNRLIEVEILATDEQIKYIQENTDDEPYIKVDVIIDGTKIENCGLRTKGSSIYEQIKNTSNQTRYGYTLELDYYQKQSYDGVTKFLLNTGMADKTCMKEMICYDIYEKAGVKTVKRCFCNLKIGSKEEGIYTLVEVPAEDYIKRYYGDNDGIIYINKK